MCVQNSIDCREADVRFDGITRVVALDSRKLLVILEKGAFIVISLIFDQAEIDVADAIFTNVKCNEAVLPSSVIKKNFFIGNIFVDHPVSNIIE